MSAATAHPVIPENVLRNVKDTATESPERYTYSLLEGAAQAQGKRPHMVMEIQSMH